MITRRDFFSYLPMTVAGAAISSSFLNDSITHYLSLSFDDGFKKSFYKIATIHERYSLQACLNVIATGHMKSFNREPKWISSFELGDFEDWNKLAQRDHEVMPHTWEHLNLTEVSIDHAKENIDKCIEFFQNNLDGFDATKSIYNFAYNASTPEIEDYAMTRSGGIRTGGWLVLNNTMVNQVMELRAPLRLGCWGQGPGYCDDYVESEINNFINSEGGWLILNLHGLDDEGWGPIRETYLNQLLSRLAEEDKLKVMPTGKVMQLLLT